MGARKAGVYARLADPASAHRPAGASLPKFDEFLPSGIRAVDPDAISNASDGPDWHRSKDPAKLPTRKDAAVTIDRLAHLDAHLLLLVNRIDLPGWGVVMGYGTDLGHQLLLTLLIAMGLRLLDRRRFPKNFAVISLAILFGGLVTVGFKHAIDRSRPLELTHGRPVEKRELLGGRLDRQFKVIDPELAQVAPTLRILGPTRRKHSFPSGHTAVAFGCAAALIYASRSRRGWLWLLPAGFVGITRLACGAHYPTDVVAGALIGSACSLFALRSTESLHGLASPPLAPAERGARRPGRLRVMMIVGEDSADVYGARLLNQLKQMDPEIEAFGIGGPELQRAGLAIETDAHRLAIVGFTDVVRALPSLLRIYRRACALLDARSPDVLVCIDLPDFNFMLALQARARGIPVLFDIGPQVWAWRSGRIPKLADRISKMIVAFPFEMPYYERHDVPVAFHGHPLLEGLERRFADRAAARSHFGLDPERPVCVIAPGSRKSELHHNIPALFGAAALLRQQQPLLQLALPLASRVEEKPLQAAAARAGLPVVFTRGDNFDLFACADLGIICSGTATLEAALAGLPMVIFYRANLINAVLAKLVVKIDRFGLPNIILGGEESVYPERIQYRASARRLAEAAMPMLRDAAVRERLRDAGAEVRRRLSGGATSRAVAEEVMALARSGPTL